MGNRELYESKRKKLLQSIQNKNLVIIAGTGVSMAACGGQEVDGCQVACWKGLLAHGVKYCVHEGVMTDDDSGKLLNRIAAGGSEEWIAVAGEISGKLNGKASGKFGEWLEGSIGNLNPSAPEILNTLGKFPAIKTTLTYDGLFAGYLNLKPVTWKDENRVGKVLRGELDNCILHLHGHYEDPDSVVFGNQSYGKVVRNLYSKAVLQSFSIRNTMLFVGCRGTLHDPNFSNLVKWGKKALRKCSHSHYVLCCDSERDELQSEFNNNGVHWLCPLPYGETHEALVPYLKTLLHDADHQPPGNGRHSDGTPPDADSLKAILKLCPACYNASNMLVQNNPDLAAFLAGVLKKPFDDYLKEKGAFSVLEKAGIALKKATVAALLGADSEKLKNLSANLAPLCVNPAFVKHYRERFHINIDDEKSFRGGVIEICRNTEERALMILRSALYNRSCEWDSEEESRNYVSFTEVPFRSTLIVDRVGEFRKRLVEACKVNDFHTAVDHMIGLLREGNPLDVLCDQTIVDIVENSMPESYVFQWDDTTWQVKDLALFMSTCRDEHSNLHPVLQSLDRISRNLEK